MLPRSLSVPRLGLALVALTLLGWLTAAPYLAVRLGLATPLPLAHIDLPHAYVGTVLCVVVGLKVWQLRIRRTLMRLRGIVAWQRWLSLALLATYAAVAVSGGLLVFPWPSQVAHVLVNAHLLAAGWAGALTIGHVARYLARRVHVGEVDPRLGAGVAAMLLPALLVSLPAAAASPLARLGDGGAWVQVGPEHAVVTRLEQMPNGDIFAAGAGLLVSEDGGRHWTSLPVFRDLIVRSVSAGPRGAPIYVGTDAGVFVAERPQGPYVPTGLKTLADSVLADPAEPGRIWAGGLGLWTSTDAGATWAPATSGLVPQGSIWTIVRLPSGLYAAGTTGIYRWTGSGWTQESTFPSVYSLDAGVNDEIWASSMGDGLAVRRNGRWVPSAAGLAAHHHAGGAVHVVGVTQLSEGRLLAATMDEGIAESLDGGRTWTAVSAGFRPGSMWQVIRIGDRLLAATNDGLYIGSLPVAAPPSVALWAVALVAAVLAGGAGAAVSCAVRCAGHRSERRVESSEARA